MRLPLVVSALLLLQAATAHAQQTPGGATVAGCPDQTDTPSLLDYAVDQAFGRWKRDPSHPLPPSCLYAVIAREPLVHSDSAILQTLQLTDATIARSPDDLAAMSARLVLLSRAGRFADVKAAFDQLATMDPSRATLAAYKLAAAAAIWTHDTAALTQYLGAAVARFPAATQQAADLLILQQLPRLRILTDTVKSVIRKNPRMTEGYTSLVSIYGNLNQPDSALSYARIALKHGVSTQSVGTALQSLIGVTLRRGQLLADPDTWEATIPRAFAIDSVASTPASKYLVALAISETVADKTRLASSISTGIFVDSRTGLSRQVIQNGKPPVFKVLTCERLAEMNAQLDVAAGYLDAGGDQFATQTIPAMRAGFQKMHSTIASLKPYCPG